MAATFPRTMGYGLGNSLPRGTSAFGPWMTADQYDYPLRDQTMTAAPTFPPFKFEPRRARIDWRLLHGIDINAMMRDVDLDTLEKIVNIVAFGDIEAEDTRHLTELNFIKIFRLSQMMIEYLLYVQDCLQNSNAWLQQDRGNMDKYVQAARLRIRELEANLKMNKRELRRTRKTIKTYELLAVFNDGKGTKAATMAATTGTVVPASPPQPQPAPPVAKPEANSMNAVLEALLRKELAALAERLGRANLECQTLRSERDDLYQAIKDLEATVKARTQFSGTSSPQAYARQNVEAIQTIQGLQDQLNRATVEITRLRNEKQDLAMDLENATSDRRQLQEEKSRLLSELAARPNDAPNGEAHSAASDNVGVLLMDAERQKGQLQDQLADARAEIAALQKELMKAMKATAFAPMGAMSQSQLPDDRALREVESVKAQLEKELAETRRSYNQDVQQLQEELESAQAKIADAERRLEELRAAGARPGQGSPSVGGFMKITEERRGGYNDVDETQEKYKTLVAEYQATNERLNQQLVQVKDERNQLASEVEQLRLQIQTQPRLIKPQGDSGITRDWRTEEIDRLKAECDACRRRQLDLEDALRDRDAMIERLRATIRELQAELDQLNREHAEMEASTSLVRQQVQRFERMAGPGSHVRTQSFSFLTPEDAPPGGSVALETPTSVRKPMASPEPPPRPVSPRAPSSTTTVEIEPQHPPRSPVRSGALPGAPHASTWLRRIPRPPPEEARDIQQSVLRRVAGVKPEALQMMLEEEIKVVTERPFEYEVGDEAKFRSMMPYDVDERPGVRSVQQHTLKDLEAARGLVTNQLLAVVDDEMAQFGIDLDAEALTDKAYAACMKELDVRRSQMLGQLPREVRERAMLLRDFLCTHLELMKRLHSDQQTSAQQHVLQEEQWQLAAAEASRRNMSITDNGGQPNPPPAVSVFESAPPPSRLESSSRSINVGRTTPGPTASANPASTRPPSAAASQPNTLSGAAPSAQSQLPAFPTRQTSMQRGRAPSSILSTEELSGMLPPPSITRPSMEATQVAASQRNNLNAGALRTNSAQISPSTSMKRTASEASADGEPTAIATLDRDSDNSRNSNISRAAIERQRSLQRTSSTKQVGPAAAPSAPTPAEITREASEDDSPVTMGYRAPGQAPRVIGQSRPAAAPPETGGNMNMSIRSVKYQESDFDDDDDVVPLAQPKPVKRIAQDDEYGLTEDEEGQQDMGIEDSSDFSSVGQPKILMRTGSPQRPSAPSRFGQSTQPAAQSRGWATDEPLQAAPPKPAAVQQVEAAEIEELESIHSFDNSATQSLRPGAWGSPSGTMQKTPKGSLAREVLNQVDATNKQTGWNETTRSYGTKSSVRADEAQEITSMRSFTDSIEAPRRFAAPSQKVATSQAAPARTTALRRSYSSDLSDIEYA